MIRPGLRFLRALAWGAALQLLAACSALEGPGYLFQSVNGHLDLLRRARPIAEMLADESTDPGLRARLERIARARRFAADRLALPDNGSYTRYSPLERPFVMWNVVAAPELSLTPRRWCFPVAGCVSYRGYYDKADADRFAAQLRSAGDDVRVIGVPAYSTLGWFDDPVPSTLLRYPDIEVARLLFHELAHQVVYLKGDSRFNESFATAVEEIGVERWLEHLRETTNKAGREALDAEREQYELRASRRREFIALLLAYRQRLKTLYSSALASTEMRVEKAATLAQLRHDYERLKRSWNGYAGYDAWFAEPTGNAHLAAVGTYHDLVPGFRAMHQEANGDMPGFFEAVRLLAMREKAERDRLLGAASRD
ncbi:MAG: aminopeptidase [Burkholderiaceae bacterium]|nr:aminopeptidase [Burkholderiaceae bacterium]